MLRTAALTIVACAASAFGVGPDVVLSDVQSTSNYGLVGSIRGYAIGSHTCNIGNQNLLWTNNGTPGLAMNMYRLHDGRLKQIGLSWVKMACCAAAGNGCGLGCNGAGGSVLGAGCLDVYSSGWNGGQTRLGPRSGINAWTGQFSGIPGGSGNAIFRRIQVEQADLVTASFPGALYFIEGVYVGSDDAANSNRNNNASYKRVNVNQSTFNLELQGANTTGIPALRAWRDHGGGIGVVDTSVSVNSIDVPNEGRFWYAGKARDLGNGTWRYDFLVFNLSSDRSGGSLSIPLSPGVTLTNVGFHAPLYHSGEPYANTPWVFTQTATSAEWTTPQTFAQNANSSALRWGTMYSFWFDANVGPVSGTGNETATLGLFKPGTPASIALTGLPLPSTLCRADFNGSGGTPDEADVAAFFAAWNDGLPSADFNMSGGVPDDADVAKFFEAWDAGC